MLKNIWGSSTLAAASSKRPKDKFSLENLKYLYSQLIKYPIVDNTNKNRLVEVLRAIAELMIWGDQHNPLFFDFFAEKNIIHHFAKILNQKCDSKVKTQVIQTLSILIQNTDSEQAIFYLLSNNYINDLIVHRFDFGDEELLAYYISFLKTLSFKCTARTILFFYNDKANDFPLYVEAIKFFNHQENMVRIAVRTLSLNIYKVEDERLRTFILDKTALPYFSNLVWFLKDQTLSLSKLMEVTNHSSISKMEEAVEALIDFFFYLQDILSLNIEKMSAILTDQLLSHYVLPVLIGSLVARYDPEKRKQIAAEAASNKANGVKESLAPHTKVLGLVTSPPQKDYSIQARLSLFLLSQVFLAFNHYGFINSIAISLLHPKPPVICETIVRTPIRHPFKHPTAPLTGIIFPKSLVVTPILTVVNEEDDSNANAEKEKKKAINEANVTKANGMKPISTSVDLLFPSPSNDEENVPSLSPPQSPLPNGTNHDEETTLDFFASTNKSNENSTSNSTTNSLSDHLSVPSSTRAGNSSPTPIANEHESLFDMFSAPTTPGSSSISSSAASGNNSTIATPPVTRNNSSSGVAPISPKTPTTTITLSQSASTPANLSALRHGKHPAKSTSVSVASIIGHISSTPKENALDNPVATGIFDNFVYVLDGGHHRVCVYDKNTGVFVKTFGKKGTGDGEMMGGDGLAVSPTDGRIYVTDAFQHRVLVFSKNGEYKHSWGSEGKGQGQFNNPSGIAISSGTGLVYVCDQFNHRIQIFDAVGSYIKQIGSGVKGEGKSDLNEPASIAVSQSPLDQSQDRIYATDYGNDRIQVFDGAGAHLLTFGKTGKGNGELSGPVGIAYSSSGSELYVCDRGNSRISVYDLQGAFIKQIGRKGSGPGELNEPNGVVISVDDGRVYVADSKNDRIVVFAPSPSHRATPVPINQGIYPSPNTAAPTITSPSSPLPSEISNGDASGGSNAVDIDGVDRKEKELPMDQNTLRVRSSVPEMKVVYNPIKSCPSYASIASTNRNRQAMMFALGSQDERVSFGAAGVMYTMMKNEVMDKDVLLACHICPQSMRKQSLLFQQLTQDQQTQSQMDQLLFARDLIQEQGKGAGAASQASNLNLNSSNNTPNPTPLPTPAATKDNSMNILGLATASSSHLPSAPIITSVSPPTAFPLSGNPSGTPRATAPATPAAVIFPPLLNHTPKKPSALSVDEAAEEEEEEAESEDEDEDEDKVPVTEETKADLDFFSGTSTATTTVIPKSNVSNAPSPAITPSTSTSIIDVLPTKPTTSKTHTFDILAEFPSTPRSHVKAITVPVSSSVIPTTATVIPNIGSGLDPPDQVRVPSSDPLLDKKPTANSGGNKPSSIFHFPILSASANPSSSTSASLNSTLEKDKDEPITFDYSSDIVAKLITIIKRQPLIRLTTLQLCIEILRELVYHSTPTHPCLTPEHMQQLRDTNRSISEDLKIRFKVPLMGNFILDSIEEEYVTLNQVVYPKVLITSTRNLLPIEEKQITSLGLEWRRPSNDYERTRKLLQFYLVLRSIRYVMAKKKDPFYPLNDTDGGAKVGDELPLDGQTAVNCYFLHLPARPMLAIVDTENLIIASKIEGKSNVGKVECIIPLRYQEPYLYKGNVSMLNIFIRSAGRPHQAAKKVKSGPGIISTLPGVQTSDTIASLSALKPLWNVCLVFAEPSGCVTIRKTLEQQRIRLRKIMMNKIYKGFEQREEEETTSVPTPPPPPPPTDGSPPPPPPTPTIVPFSILNFVGERAPEIEESDE